MVSVSVVVPHNATVVGRMGRILSSGRGNIFLALFWFQLCISPGCKGLLERPSGCGGLRPSSR